MFAQATKDFDQLKGRRKTTLTTGDYDVFSGYLEIDAERFSRRLGVTPGIQLLDVDCGAASDPAYEVDVPALFFERARSLAESQVETARYREALRQKEFNEEKRSQ